jgi:hypothetical protein
MGEEAKELYVYQKEGIFDSTMAPIVVNHW